MLLGKFLAGSLIVVVATAQNVATDLYDGITRRYFHNCECLRSSALHGALTFPAFVLGETLYIDGGEVTTSDWELGPLVSKFECLAWLHEHS